MNTEQKYLKFFQIVGWIYIILAFIGLISGLFTLVSKNPFIDTNLLFFAGSVFLGFCLNLIFGYGLIKKQAWVRPLFMVSFIVELLMILVNYSRLNIYSNIFLLVPFLLLTIIPLVMFLLLGKYKKSLEGPLYHPVYSTVWLIAVIVTTIHSYYSFSSLSQVVSNIQQSNQSQEYVVPLGVVQTPQGSLWTDTTTNHFSIVFPMNWQIRENISGAQVAAFEGANDPEVKNAILIRISPIKPGSTIEDLKKISAQMNISVEDSTLGGLPALKSVATTSDIKVVTYSTLKEGKIYQLITAATPKLFDVMQPLFDQSIQSFKFIK